MYKIQQVEHTKTKKGDKSKMMMPNNNQESSGLAIGADLWISLKLSITVDYTANEELQVSTRVQGTKAHDQKKHAQPTNTRHGSAHITHLPLKSTATAFSSCFGK